MTRRPSAGPIASAAFLLLLGSLALAVPVAGQDPSSPPLGPPLATPIADPPAVPAGDGTGVRLHTELGDIVIGLFTESSPVAAENFLNLASTGFYDGTVFHRIVPGFVIQGGDPTGTGTGDPGYSIIDEPVVGQYGRGIVAMARSQAPNSQGSQFFIVLEDDARAALEAARTYAIFGRVVEGMDVVDQIAAGPASGDQALEPVAVESTTIEDVILPAEPSPPPPTIDEDLAGTVRLTVGGQALTPQTITGTAMESQFGSEDSIVVGLRQLAEGQGRTMDDVSVVVAGLELADGSLFDITGLRLRGADAASLVVPFTALITGDTSITATPSTLGGKEVLVVSGSDQPVPITGYVNGEFLLLIRTSDAAARDEVLAQLP